MKNKELIEALKVLPEDADVKLCYCDMLYTFNRVRMLGKHTILLADEYEY